MLLVSSLDCLITDHPALVAELSLRHSNSTNSTSSVSPSQQQRRSLSQQLLPPEPVLLGDVAVPVINGVARWGGLLVRAQPGTYELQAAVSGSGVGAADAAVAPLAVAVHVPACALGEVARDGGTSCQACDAPLFTLWVDNRDGGAISLDAVVSQSHQSLGRCSPCPPNAVCSGGPQVVPRPGFWHSSPNSTLFHTCPQPASCRSEDPGQQAALQRCQSEWYRTRVPGEGVLLEAATLLEPARRNGTTLCLLWGDAPGGSVTYLDSLCVHPNQGTLCATCAPGYAVGVEFDCTRCPDTVARNAAIGIAMFTLNVLLTLYTLWTAFTDEADVDTADELDVSSNSSSRHVVQPGDVLQSLIRHAQHFIIITRLAVDWPDNIKRLQALLSSATGAEAAQSAYSPACFFPGADSALQARAQVLAAIIVPGIVCAVVMMLWALRHRVWNQRAASLPSADAAPDSPVSPSSDVDGPGARDPENPVADAGPDDGVCDGGGHASSSGVELHITSPQEQQSEGVPVRSSAYEGADPLSKAPGDGAPEPDDGECNRKGGSGGVGGGCTSALLAACRGKAALARKSLSDRLRRLRFMDEHLSLPEQCLLTIIVCMFIL